MAILEKNTIYHRIKKNPIIPIIVMGLAGFLYSFQAWQFTRTQRSLLDEGNYLLKGYLFVTKQYVPYQDFGVWTNKMPLAFLVPGYIQKIFGPGLLTGRNYALVLSLLILVLAVIIGVRLGGKWGGALTAVVLAFSPAPLKVYTRVLTEGLTAVMLLIVLLCILGRDRPTWQLLIGSFVAGLIPVTRLNLIPVLPLVILYVLIEYGWKKGLISLAVSLTPLIAFHWLYWPGIFFQLWAKWIPSGLIPARDLWKLGFGDALQVRQTNFTNVERLLAFTQGIRFHLPALLGVFVSISLWPVDWPDRSRKRTALFLLVLFGVLFILHMWAAIFKDYNIHAFFRYLCSFSFLGVFLVLTTWDQWNFKLKKWRQFTIGSSLLVLALLVGYSISEQSSALGVWFKDLLENGFYVFSGEGYKQIWNWWDGFQTRLGWDYAATFQALVLGFSILLIVLSVLVMRGIKRRRLKNGLAVQPGAILPQVLILVYLLGILISPTKVFGRGFVFYDCPKALRQYEVAVNQTAPLINQGEQVFYVGKDTQVVLLSMVERKGIQIYPQQLNAYNSYYLGGDSLEITRRGLWNEAIAQEWVDRSQVLLFEQQAIAGYFEETAAGLDLSDFELVGETNNTCTYDQRIYIYRKD